MQIFTGANVWINGEFKKMDVAINKGKVTDISNVITPSDMGSTIINKVDECYLIPGLVDMHVHFREPGYSYKETIATGSRAAAMGGFTTVCTMPNLNPAPDSLENLQKQLDIIDRDAVVQVIPYATITKKRMGNELVDYFALAPFVAGFSDDGSGVQDEEVMREAMKGIAKTGKILAAHCEVNSLLKGGYIHDGEYARMHNHRGICSESEWREVERDIRLSEETGCRLHVCHISTKESVDLIRKAKARGVNVTCETGPHYLVFCDEDLQEDGRFKMNPPLRSRADMEALIEGIADGTIDVIATDHAPHSKEEKSKGLEKSAMGVVGLETAFPAVYTHLVKTGIISLERMVELMSINPRKILGLPATSGITVGMKGDLTVLDLRPERKVVGENFCSLGSATPFEGMNLYGSPVLTFCDGRGPLHFYKK
ncbi:MAG: dihydroorotase [Bacteroides sp.]|nr:dihydroorotase [Bacteroides sp.]